MDNGFSTSDAVLTAAMSGGGFGGRGGGQWGGGYYGSPFADMGSNAVRINRNNEVTKAETRCLEAGLGANLDRISDQNSETRNILRFDSIKDGQFQAELRNGDRLRDIEREIANNARVADKCCCDAKILTIEKFAELSKQQAVDNGSVQARLSAIDAKLDANKEIGEKNAMITALETRIACGCVTGCSTPCPS